MRTFVLFPTFAFRIFHPRPFGLHHKYMPARHAQCTFGNEVRERGKEGEGVFPGTGLLTMTAVAEVVAEVV